LTLFPAVQEIYSGCCTCLGNKRKANRAALRYPADRIGTQHKE
jgi:hypothetical protein